MEKELHRLLKRQLKKLADGSEMTLSNLDNFISIVNETYFQMDRERRFLENALDVTSKELTGVNNKLQLFIENAPTGIAMLDNRMRYLYASQRWLKDRRLTNVDIVGRSFYDCSPETDYMKIVFERCLKGQGSAQEEEKIVQSDGSVRWVRWETRPWMDDDGKVGGIVVFSEDITDRKVAEEEFRIASVAFQSNDGMVVSDVTGKILRANESISRLTGYDSDELIGRNTSIFRSPSHHDATFYRNLWEAIKTEGKWEGNIWNRHKSGYPILFWLSISAVRDSEGKITHFVAIYSNSSDPKEAERRITELAYYDPLTNLPNRRLLLDRLNQAKTMAKRNKIYGAIILIDIDKFKNINDTRGHDVGDQVLIEVSKRLRSSLREVDTAARLGGDEFLVLVPELGKDLYQAENSLLTICNKLHLNISKPVSANSVKQVVTCSIGAALFSEKSLQANDLLKEADLALYDAKSAGRNTIRCFTQGLHDEFVKKVDIENDLRLAIERDEFTLMYQPQVDKNEKIVGAEALLRWHPIQKAPVDPDIFIPVAEETGLIVAIGEWVLKKACAELAQWSNSSKTKDVVLSINISSRQFRQPDFPDKVAQIVTESSINPSLLKLELTESLLLSDVDQVIDTMNKLREIGIIFSIDDFGTGYSSLSYLKRLPLNEIKIDKNFVADIASSEGDRAIIQSIFALAKALHLNVVAEGVESIVQRDLLIEEGCVCFQGYLYSKPLTADGFASLLAS